MYTLKNDLLQITVKKAGAELCDISSAKHKTKFMWRADPKIWGSYAPNLFPIIGALKDDTYIYKNQKFKLSKHGFVRNNEQVKLLDETEDSLTFVLRYNEDSLKVYPFKFEFKIKYTLKQNTLEVKHVIENLDSSPMYFSVGGHPAFKCPVFDDEVYSDYTLEFEQVENSVTHLLNMENGLVSNNTELVFNNSKTLRLRHEMFEMDALIFKDLKSRKVALKSKKHGEIFAVCYSDFNYLGIWAKPNGDYVCIEPWLGIADSEDTNQELTTKEGIIKLDAQESFTAAYHIEINQSHLG